MGARSLRGWLLVFGLVAVTAAALVVHQVTRSQTPPSPPGGVLLVVPSDADPLTLRLEDMTARYLSTIAGRAVTQVAMDPTMDPKAASLDTIEQLAAVHRAGLVVVLEADRLAPEQVEPARIDALGSEGFVLETHEVEGFANDLGDDGATVVLTAGGGRLARQYAAYELLRRLGVRFFHPEQEYVPVHEPEDLRALARRPTVLHRKGQDYRPDFASRSWSFHRPHPLEHLEAFSDPDHPIDEAVHVTDWIVKNFGNRFRGTGRSAVSAEATARRAAELDQLRQLLGFARGVSLSLHNLQQGANAEIDPTQPTSVRVQIDQRVAQKLAAAPDAVSLGVHFGVTEFTTTPDRQTVQWLDWVGEAVRSRRPDMRVVINNHITGRQPSPHYDDQGCPNGTNEQGRIDYYDLAFHTDPRLGVSVHTVMFYPLEGPARVYNQRSFAHKLCLMQQASAQGRPLTWFPEGAWWLSFDNPIPVYLPLYLYARARDIELLRPLLASRGGTLDGHRMFNSGQEWGYWQQDYAVGLMAWNADVTLTEVLGEIFDPLCAPVAWRSGCLARTEAIAVLEAVIEHQRQMFLEREDVRGRPGGLYAYFAGEDDGDRIAADSGMEFRPVRMAFDEVLGWDEPMLARFERTDGAALQEAATAYEGWRARLAQLRPAVPTAGRPWLDEVIDGLEINALRASHAAQLYGTVIDLRRAQLEAEDGASDRDPVQAAQAQWTAAGQTKARAKAVIRRRERAYRYPPAQTHGGGLTAQDGQVNGTTYPYRVHTKTHRLTYWNNRHQQVAAILKRIETGGLELRGVIAAPGTPLAVQWPPDGGAQGVQAAVTVGPQTIEPGATTVDLGASAGLWPVGGSITYRGQTRTLDGSVVRSAVRATTPRGGMKIQRPDHDTARRVLGSVMPSVRWAWLDDPPTLVLAPDPDRDGSVAFGDLVRAPVAQGGRAGFVTAPVTVVVPVALGSGGDPLSITLSEVVLRGRVGSEGLVAPLEIEGRISVDDIVHAGVVLAGFEPRGMQILLAGIFGFDSSDPPATAPIAAQLDLERTPL
ncbi:MAG: hypothetical protein AAGF11_52080 [Myxococcota bacterium]